MTLATNSAEIPLPNKELFSHRNPYFGEHVKKIMGKGLARPDNLVPLSKKILLITTHRCGSHLFFDVLNNTNSVGYIEEWFNPSMFGLEKDISLDYEDYLSFVLRKTSQRDISILPVHVEFLEYYKKAKFFDLVKHYKPTCTFYLARRDVKAQIYSYAKSLANDEWVTYKDSPRTPSTKDVLYATHGILKQISYFNKNLKKEVTSTFYIEDFMDLENPTAFEEVLSYCSVETSELKYFTNLKKQEGSITHIEFFGELHDVVKKVIDYSLEKCCTRKLYTVLEIIEHNGIESTDSICAVVEQIFGK